MGFELDEKGIINKIDKEFQSLLYDSKLISKIIDKKLMSKIYYSLSKNLKWRLYNLMKWEKLFDVKTSDT